MARKRRSVREFLSDVEYEMSIVVFAGAALVVCLLVYYAIMASPLFFLVFWLIPFTTLIAAVCAFLITTKAPPLGLRYAVFVLPVVLYFSGRVAAIPITWMDEQTPNYYTMSYNGPLIDTVVGPYEIPIVALWVGILARSWRAAHMSSR